MKKIVLKVAIVGDGCKTDIMKTISKLNGIKSIALDAEKGTVTVIGDVDPVLMLKELRKSKRGFPCFTQKIYKCVEIDTVGPPEEKKEDKKDPTPCPPYCCPTTMPMGNVVWMDQEPQGCTIL